MLPFLGKKCAYSRLKNPRLLSLCRYLNKYSVRLKVSVIDYFIQENGKESILLKLDEIGIPQFSPFQLKDSEEVAIVFEAKDKQPDVIPWREDFPRLLHTNLPRRNEPITLCLYNQSPDEVLLSWSPSDFMHRLRLWYRNNARGILHGDEQPLEPFLSYEPGYLMLMPDTSVSFKHLNVEIVRVKNELTKGRVCIKLCCDPYDERAFFLTLVLDPKVHAPTCYAPSTLGDLFDLLSISDTQIIDALTKIFNIRSVENDVSAKTRLYILVEMPKLRDDESERIEESEIAAYMVLSAEAMLLKSELYQIDEASGQLIGKENALLNTNAIRKIDVLAIKVSLPLSRQLAAKLNHSKAFLENVFAVGAGAIGSHIIHNLAKSGFGKWFIMDDDILLPHNTAKHVLSHEAVGRTKVSAMDYFIGSLFGNDDIVNAVFHENLLHMDAEKKRILKAMNESSLIFDFSASVHAERFLARNINSQARRISAFLNPKGDHLVILTEDSSRENKLDLLEHQLYLSILENVQLSDYWEKSSMMWIGRGCSDMTSIVPNDNFELFAAIASRQIKNAISSSDASINVYKLNSNNEVVRINIPTESFLEITLSDGFFLSISSSVLERMQELRNFKSGVETGGILLGSYDPLLKRFYVLMPLSEPPDSVSSYSYFERGKANLRTEVEQIQKQTNSAIFYIGEWHSHPENSSQPSQQDKKAYKHLYDTFIGNITVPIMLICAGNSNFSAIVNGRSTTFRYEKR